MILQLSEEVSKLRGEPGEETLCVERAIRSCQFEEAPLREGIGQVLNCEQLGTWELWVATKEFDQVEVYTYGALRYRNPVATTVMQQPAAFRQPVFVQGGILFHFGHQPRLLAEDNITITMEQGFDVELLLPSSIENYTALLVVRLLKHSKLCGTIHTDYAEAVRITTAQQLRNLGQKANLPIYNCSLLEQTKDIWIKHVKAHGPIKKKFTWTREQWGNFYADRIAKGIREETANKHLRCPVPELEEWL